MSVIAPESIDLSVLPSLALTDRRSLPSVPAIYFCLSKLDEVLYIGQTINIAKRWKHHHCHKDLEKMDEVRIAWLKIDEPRLLTEIEYALILWFNPPLNNLNAQASVSPCNRNAVQQANVRIRCRLQDLLDERNLTRSSLSGLTGLTSGAIRGLCENTAKRYDVDTLAVVCTFFGCDMGELFEVVPKNEQLRL